LTHPTNYKILLSPQVRESPISMIRIIGRNTLLTSKAVLAAFTPRAKATGLPSNAPHVIIIISLIDLSRELLTIKILLLYSTIYLNNILVV
ncbi:MAG: hypothetical protein AB4372_20705, partial [Xenococcus sp. (in: cyanobacteria)]